MELPDVLKKIREVKGWTQEELGRQLGVAKQTVQRAESAGSTLRKRWPFFLAVVELSQELGILDEARKLDAKEIARNLIAGKIDDRPGNYRAPPDTHAKKTRRSQKASGSSLPKGGTRKRKK